MISIGKSSLEKNTSDIWQLGKEPQLDSQKELKMVTFDTFTNWSTRVQDDSFTIDVVVCR